MRQAPSAPESGVRRFLEVLGRVERHRSMYVHDDRYATLAAFVDGYGTAAHGILDGFSAWLSLRTYGPGAPPARWTTVIVERVVPDATGRGELLDLAPEEDVASCAELFRMLREFLTGADDAAGTPT